MESSDAWDSRTRPEVEAIAADCFKLGAKIRSLGGLAKASREGRTLSPRADNAADHLEAAARTLRAYLTGDGSQAKSGLVASCVNRLIRGLGMNEADAKHAGDASNDPGEFSGHSRAIGITEALEFLSFYQKTGLLHVATDDENFVLQLNKGEVVHAASDNSPPGLRLGEILVKQGAISADTLRELLNKGSKRRLGELLGEDQLVEQHALRAALEFQVQQLFTRLFSAEETYFVFREGKIGEADGRLRMSVTSLLLESASSVDEQGAEARDENG